jgi:hypothetical protein
LRQSDGKFHSNLVWASQVKPLLTNISKERKILLHSSTNFLMQILEQTKKVLLHCEQEEPEFELVKIF